MGRLTTTTLLAALLLAGSPAAFADDHAQARELRQSGEILPLQEILAGLDRELRVLEAELEWEHDGYRYEVEVLDSQGQVWEYLFDARSGELLRQQRED